MRRPNLNTPLTIVFVVLITIVALITALLTGHDGTVSPILTFGGTAIAAVIGGGGKGPGDSVHRR